MPKERAHPSVIKSALHHFRKQGMWEATHLRFVRQDNAVEMLQAILPPDPSKDEIKNALIRLVAQHPQLVGDKVDLQTLYQAPTVAEMSPEQKLADANLEAAKKAGWGAETDDPILVLDPKTLDPSGKLSWDAAMKRKLERDTERAQAEEAAKKKKAAEDPKVKTDADEAKVGAQTKSEEEVRAARDRAWVDSLFDKAMADEKQEN